MKNMKRYLLGFAVICAALSMASCRKVQTSVDGTDKLGKLIIKTDLEGNYVEKQSGAPASVPFSAKDLTVAVYKYDGDNLVAVDGKKWKVSEIASKVGLDVGNYCLQGFSIEGDQPEVSDVPYFYGKKDFSVALENETEVQLTASIQDSKVSVVTTDAFDLAFSDWTISVAKKAAPETELFLLDVDAASKFMKPASFVMTVTATKRNAAAGAEPWTKKIEVNDPKVADWFNVTLDVVAVGTATVTVKVENTLTQKDITIDIPNDDEDLGDGGIITPDPGGDPDPGISGPSIAGLEGLNLDEVLELSISRGDIVNMECKIPVKISITAEDGGIQTLGVLIDSDEQAFMNTINVVLGANEFDLANLVDGSNLKNALIGVGLIDADEQIKGEKNYVFDITGFMGMLMVNTSPTNAHRFTISVTDANEEHEQVTKTLTVRVVE